MQIWLCCRYVSTEVYSYSATQWPSFYGGHRQALSGSMRFVNWETACLGTSLNVSILHAALFVFFNRVFVHVYLQYILLGWWHRLVDTEPSLLGGLSDAKLAQLTCGVYGLVTHFVTKADTASDVPPLPSMFPWLLLALIIQHIR